MTSSLCSYRHIFGKEREGVHSIRLFDIAVIDLLLTIAGAWLIARAFKWNFWLVLVVVLLVGIVMHRLFCVNTTINTKIFGTVH